MSSASLSPVWPSVILAAMAILVGLFIVMSLRGSSRLQRRLFLLFLLMSLVPATAVLLVNWTMVQRQMRFLESPGLQNALESSLDLARRTLERERADAQATADDLAARIAAAERPLATERPPATERPLPVPPEGCSYRFGERTCGGVGIAISDPFEAVGQIDPREIDTPIRMELEGISYLIAVAWVREPLTGGVRGAGTPLILARRLDADLSEDLDVIVQGSTRFRQLRFYYGRFLRSDTLLTLAALCVVLLAASLLLSRRLARQIGGPMSELVRGTQLVAAGDLDHRVRAKALDELGDLVDAFNRMTRELKHSKDELIRAERIAAWQGIARRLAHEIKNPLTPIGLSMHRIRRKVDDPTVTECVDAVLEEIENLKQLADEFSLYARLPVPSKGALNIVELVREVAELYTARGRIEVHWDGWPDELWLMADSGQIRQVFSNLVKNAVEAMGSVGSLTLRMRREGTLLSVLIEDTGPGFPVSPEDLFEPYFSTKQSGTGLGLAIARKIVEDHGGRLLAVKSEGARSGATFRVDLPGLLPGRPVDDQAEGCSMPYEGDRS
ncbi:MAG: HAMP domain-containing protein [Candidatus Eisenbacteria sp.]|nr:HAMP domain-containing protein [Candidatus Eisenbacteria bacterium]